MKKTLLLLFILITGMVCQLNAQHEITGILTDANSKEALIGATVIIKGSTNGVTTGLDGSFRLDYQGSFPMTLLFTYIGYQNRELILNSSEPLSIQLIPSTASLSEVTVTSRRRKEIVQDVPIPITVLGAPQIENSVSFNVNRVKDLIPSVQLYSSNPRNTTLNIRGLGSTFGLTNDGIDPGVGFYVDGVYYSRPAATAIDFIDVEQIEVLRGPQGTLFGKNTTAGAFNVTTRKPDFNSAGTFELSYGNLGFVQAKGAVTGPLIKDKLALRLSFNGTHRDGTIYNTRTEKYTNTMNNIGVRGQLLYKLSEHSDIILAADHTRQRPDGYAQVYAGVAPTKRADYRQFDAIIKDLNYIIPNKDPFKRIIDHDTPWKSGQDMGGISINANFKLGSGTLTSTTAWRYWNWDPSNDRDFTGLEGLRLSQAPSRHDQASQEIRYAAVFSPKLSGVFGVFTFAQKLRADGAHTEEAGKDQWRFSQSSTSPLWETPGLLEGYGIRSYPNLDAWSVAVFSQVDWSITKRLSLLPGLRFNFDKKTVDYRRETYGGLQTTDPQLLAIKNSVYSNQAFKASTDDNNFSGQLSLAYKVTSSIKTFATYSRSYKPVGLNLGGLPSAQGQPLLELVRIKPESVNHYEVGFKSRPIEAMILNVTVYNTEIKDYQTLVQAADLSVNRGYLANAEKVRVSGVEVDAACSIGKYLSLNGAVSYTEGKYVSFTNAPPPLEETGGPTFKDVSGGQLPGLSKWATSYGFEATTQGEFLGNKGNFFIAADGYYRSSFSSNPSPSKYLVVEGYNLINGRIGFRSIERVSVFLWCRNMLDKNYFEQLLPGAGNAGLYAGVLGDQRTFGITLRARL